MKLKHAAPDVEGLAGMMAAMGNGQRLVIMRLLLSSHPEGMVVGDIQSELGIPGSTLSHHLEKLRIAGLVGVRRESRFLRYSVDPEALGELIGFLYSECCSRSMAVSPEMCIPVFRRGKK